MMSSTFLTIPPEIQDVIVEDLVLSERPAPVSPAEAAPYHQNWIPAHSLDRDGKPTDELLTSKYTPGARYVLFENPTNYNSNAISLRLVNRELNERVSSAVARLGSRSTCHYKLDVLFVNERELWPTWLSVPVLTDRVEQVDVTFRIFGNIQAYPGHQGPYIMFGCGGPVQVLWCFYYLMESFLRRGPVLSASQDRKVSIKVLNLNFVAGEGEQMYDKGERALWWKAQRNEKQTDPNDKRIMRPEWLTSWLAGELRSLLGMSYHTAQYGGILHKRIGTIHLFTGGELLCTLEPAQILSALSYDDPGNTFGHVWPRENRISRFWEWKEKAERRRKERGLPVIQSKRDAKETET